MLVLYFLCFRFSFEVVAPILVKSIIRSPHFENHKKKKLPEETLERIFKKVEGLKQNHEAIRIINEVIQSMYDAIWLKMPLKKQNCG